MSVQYMLFYGNGNKMLLKLISAIICSTFWQKSQETIYLTNTSNPALYTISTGYTESMVMETSLLFELKLVCGPNVSSFSTISENYILVKEKIMSYIYSYLSSTNYCI